MTNRSITITLSLALIGACDPDSLPTTTGGTPTDTTGSGMETMGDQPTTTLPEECAGKVPIIQPSKKIYNECPPDPYMLNECYTSGSCLHSEAEETEGLVGMCVDSCDEDIECEQGGVCRKDLAWFGVCVIPCGPCDQCPGTHSCVDGACWPKA